MSKPTPTQEPDRAPPLVPPKRSEGMYWLVVAVLVVTILATLAFLWQRERKRRIRAETDLAEVVIQSRQMQQQAKQAMVQGMLGRRPAMGRASLPVRLAMVDGEPREVLLLGAAQAEAMGLRPGDLLEVTRPLTTRPATTPAPDPPAPQPAEPPSP